MKQNILTYLLIVIGMSTFGQTQKNIIVEHFTNTRCSVCAIKNPALFNLLNEYPEVMHIAYHPSSPYSNCYFSQHNPMENDDRTQYYGIYGGTPRVVLSGTVLPVQSPMLNASQLEAVTEGQSNYSIELDLNSGSGNSTTVDLRLEKLENDGIEDLSLYVILVEREVAYAAPNGESLHHNVFRLELGTEDISMMENGDVEDFTYSYNLHSAWQAEEMYAIAMLTSQGSKEVLQAGKSNLAGEQTGIISKDVKEINNLISPNPFQQSFRINAFQEAEVARLTIYNLYGQRMIEAKNTNRIQTLQWPKGMYILELEDVEGNIYASKIQKQ